MPGANTGDVRVAWRPTRSLEHGKATPRRCFVPVFCVALRDVVLVGVCAGGNARARNRAHVHAHTSLLALGSPQMCMHVALDVA